MTKEEAKKFGLQLLHGIMERNESYPVYANNVKQAIDALSEPNGSSEIPKDLEEAAKEYFENPENSWEVRDVFIAAAKWDREQMMSKAVEGEVKDFRFVREINYSNAKIEFNSIPKLKEGDRVCLIVLPKEN